MAHSYGDMAVLTRTAYNTRELEESLASRGVPYTVEGGSCFFSRPEVRAPLALLALCATPQVIKQRSPSPDEWFLRFSLLFFLSWLPHLSVTHVSVTYTV